jgi:hypothetical protein
MNFNIEKSTQAQPKSPATSIDWTKPVRMVGSKTPVRILAVDMTLDMPVLGVVQDSREIDVWRLSGGYRMDHTPSVMDLEQAPQAAEDRDAALYAITGLIFRGTHGISMTEAGERAVAFLAQFPMEMVK